MHSLVHENLLTNRIRLRRTAAADMSAAAIAPETTSACLAIVGIGDPELAALVDPPLTMMAVSVRGMPLDAMELLLQRVVHSRDSPRRIIHPMELRVRASHTRFPA